MNRVVFLPLSDIVDKIIDYRGKTPFKHGGDWSEIGYRVLSARNVKTKEIAQQSQIRHVNQELYSKWMRDEIEFGDIIITSEAPFGKVYQWNSDEKIVLGQRLFALRCKNEYHAPYIFQYMTGETFSKELYGRSSGSTVIGIRQPELLKCRVAVPDFETQKQIAHVLSTLDRKIEVNNQINSELEKLAKTIYEYWFVQFDFPNEHGKPYKSSGGEMVYNEVLKREIPKGWAVEKLVAVTKSIQSGGTPSRKESSFFNGSVNWFTTTELNDKHLLNSSENVSAIAINNSSAKIFPIGSVLIAIYASPTAGRLGILTAEGAFNQAIAGIIPRDNFSTNYIYSILLNERRRLLSKASGTAQQNLSSEIIKNFEVLNPCKEILIAYNQSIVSIFEKLSKNRTENLELAKLRDFLLPMLMNGQVTVGGVNE